MVDEHIVVDGQFVSAEIERIVLAIKDYSPELHVDWIPPGARRHNQAAFKVVHRPVGSPEYVLMTVKDEKSFDATILQRIIAGDQRNGPAPTYSELEAYEQAQKLIQHQLYLDKMEEAKDIASHLIKTPKSRYVVSKDLIVDDAIPFNVAGLNI